MTKPISHRDLAAAADADAHIGRAEAAFERGDFAHARRLMRQFAALSASDPAAVSDDQRARARPLEHRLGRDRTALILGIAAAALFVVVCLAMANAATKL